MERLVRYRNELLELASPEGGWGYRPGQPSHPEPSCFALLALEPTRDDYAEAISRGFEALELHAVGDGRFRLNRGRPEAVWNTAQVLFTRYVFRDFLPDRGEAESISARLLAIRGKQVDDDDREVNDVDGNLVGWPWATPNFSWVEPTAWACLALRKAGQDDHPRVWEGGQLLLDRALESGGVNYGNRNVLGKPLDPIPASTALMLLALQGGEPDERITRAVDYLCGRALEGDDIEHLCWSTLALDSYRHHPGVEETLRQIPERIEAAWHTRRMKDTCGQSVMRLALTILALHVPRHNPFRLEKRGQAPFPHEKRRLSPFSEGSDPAPSWGERIGGFFRNLMVGATSALRPLPARSVVHIAPAGNYNQDLVDVLSEQYGHFREQTPLKGKRVVLKPNLVEFRRDKVINTHPHLIAAAIELCKREGAAEVLVAEGPGHWRNAEYLVEESGLGDVLRHYRVPFVDLNHDEPVKRLNLGRLTKLDYLYLARTIATADVVISLPKLKTHHWAGATLSLKNLFGTLPGICYGWPKNELHWRGIDQSIVDIALTRTPDLAIVDGIVAMEGDGPLKGDAKALGVVVMGTDLLAVDATCCRLMQLDPTKVLYCVLGARKKLGRLDAEQIEQRGEAVADRAQPFATVPHLLNLRLCS
jgi:uncharacterized protein (DUF362 family)